MKFKWTGQKGIKSLDLVLAGIMKPTEELFTGKIIEIPDSETELIERIKINGNYEVYTEPKKVKLPKKSIKTDKKQEEKEE